MIRAAFIFLGLLGFAPALADDRAPARVVALGGAVTETVHALGQGHRLVARDTTSSYPPEVLDLPDVGYVRALSPEGVLSMRPDLIIAEEGAGPPETIAVLEAAGIPFHKIASGHDPESVAARIEAVAEALGTPQSAAGPLAALRSDLAAVEKARAGATPRRVMFILSAQGGRVMAAGQNTSADAMLRLAGAQNAVTGFVGYKPLTDEAITRAAPDVIVLMDRGAEGDHSVQDSALLAMPAIAATPAGRNGALVRMDGLYLLGFGPRTGRAALDLHNAIAEAG